MNIVLTGKYVINLLPEPSLLPHLLCSCRLLVKVIDKEWAKDTLPAEDIAVPPMELPDPDPDDGNTHDSLTTLKQIERKWSDLALNRINNQ